MYNDGKKKPNLVALFLVTMTGVVALGVAVFLVYGFATGHPALNGVKSGTGQGASADGTVIQDGNNAGAETASEDAYTGREPISADDPAVLGVQSDSTDKNTDSADSDDAGSDGSLKSRYSGVYERFGDDLDDPEYLAANKIYVLESRDADPESVTLTFGGDILFDDEYAVTARLLQNGGEISAGVDSALISMMSGSDITMVNNEFPYSYGGSPTPDKTYTFRADPPTVRYLRDMGVNAVGIANNHAFDFGEQAFMDTLTTLEDAGMPYCGGGRNIKDASAPLYFVVDDIKIGVIAATQIERLENPDTRGATDKQAGVFRCLNPTKLLETITDAKDKCDFLVVFIHWGTESTTDIDWLQLDQAPKIAEAGADLIIGAHPHVLQGIGTSKGVPVFYSLGNFWFNSKELDTCLVQAVVSQSDSGSGRLSMLRFVPCRQVGCKTYPASGEERDRIINDMRAMSPGIDIDQSGFITY
ncbi:MAG: CapA family protein [Clostridiales bacterium]|nr:CapA family protein [Clostridiales bacterium]